MIPEPLVTNLVAAPHRYPEFRAIIFNGRYVRQDGDHTDHYREAKLQFFVDNDGEVTIPTWGKLLVREPGCTTIVVIYRDAADKDEAQGWARALMSDLKIKYGRYNIKAPVKYEVIRLEQHVPAAAVSPLPPPGYGWGLAPGRRLTS